jgi:hypothetical protein
MAQAALSKALKTDINKPSVTSDPVPDLMKRQQEASQEELAASQKLTELETRKAESEAKRTAELDKTKVADTAAITARQEEREKPIREQKKVVDDSLMNAHFEPSQENFRDQAALFSLINVIGFAIGAGGKQHAQQAMSAMNGMLEGHQKGRADVFKEESVKFDKNFKALQQKAVFLESELRHSLEEYTRDKRSADERATAAFSQAGADFMKVYAEKNGLVAAYERAKEVRKSIDKAIEGERLRKERVEDNANRDRERRELVLATRQPSAPKTERQTAAQIAAGFGTGPSALVEEFIGDRLPTKQAEPIVQAAAAIGEANQLKNIVSKDKGIVGREGQIRQYVDRYIKSAASGQDLPTDQESGLNQEALLFAKRYASYLVNYERSLAPGSRGFTVFFQKRFNDLMQPNQFNSVGMKNLLDDQIREVATQATRISSKANVENLTALGNSITSRAESKSAPVAEPTATKKAMPSGEKLSTYTKAHPEFGGDEEKAKAFLRSQGYD